MRINVRVVVILFPNPDSVLGQGFREFPITDPVWFSAKGAVSLPAWGNAPGFVKPTKPTGAESAIPFLGNFDARLSHAQSLAGMASIRRAVVSRIDTLNRAFQRCVTDDPIPGGCPGSSLHCALWR
jgi:hypothetical protein